MSEPTPSQLRCLEHLAQCGTSSWYFMPKRRDGRAALGFNTFEPMIRAGWVTSKFYKEPACDWYFTITDEGRAALSRARGSTGDER